MNVFFDTEFTDLLSPTLISIGFISGNQRTLYLELQGWTSDECSYFVLEAVLPLLDAPRRLSIAEAATAVATWLNCLDNSVTLICDSQIDHELLSELLYVARVPKPQSISGTSVYSPSNEGEVAREQLYASTLRRHHALDDAKAFFASWEATGG